MAIDDCMVSMEVGAYPDLLSLYDQKMRTDMKVKLVLISKPFNYVEVNLVPAVGLCIGMTWARLVSRAMYS